jgi:transposase/Pyruvate/2-oxoacid:ferredoxin oxidoreductase delta subunit
MMGGLKNDQGQLFYEFHLADVPEDHLVRKIDTALDLSWLRGELAAHYSSRGRPSIDPELMIRMLIVGYVFAIRSEWLICREVQVNLAYRWFCKLSIEDAIPDHSVFSRARNERFRESDVFRRVFDRVVETCIAADLVGGEGFAVDASLIAADANKQRSIAGGDWRRDGDPERSSRAVKEYLATLDDTAWGAASEVVPKFVSPSDPAAQWTGAHKGPAFFAYSDNYLIDVKYGVIVDVEASRAIRQAEVGAAKTMIERTEERFGLKPERLAGDTAYGSGANLNWLVNDKDITPHIPVIDKSKREDGTFSREDFTFDKDRNVYICPANKILTTTGKLVNDGETLLYRTKRRDCRGCLLKAQCCPKASIRKIPRSIYEARDVARSQAKTEAFKQSSRDRKRVEMLFAHLKRILRLGRLRLRGPCGAQFEFTLAAIAQNIRRLAKLIARLPPIAPACVA